MRKTLVALCFVLAISLLGVGFAQEVTPATTDPSTPNILATPNEEPPAETLVDTGKTEHNIQETKPTVAIPAPTISSDPMTLEEMSSLLLFDIELESAYAFASQTENIIIKKVVGTVTVLAENENGIHELQISVPELNNTFCLDCIEPFTQQLGDTVTVYVVIQTPN